MEPEVRQTYKNWFVTYGKVQSKAKFASFKMRYGDQEWNRASLNDCDKAMALIAGTEYVPHSLEMINMHSDMICAESSVMIDQFGGERWMPQLHKDASDAYRLWYHKHHKEPSNESSLLSS